LYWYLEIKEVRAKKSYGQHFLNNESIAERIADSLLQIKDVSNILEVGPGMGMLTKYLLEKEANLKVVEADRDMVKHLEYNYPSLTPNIISADFLKVEITDIFEKEPFLLIGNYPYNISSQIVFKMLDHRNLIPEMVGMFQKEVAERIVAPEGNKTYGVVSVLVQAFYKGEYLFTVENGNFTPPPKVRSAVIRLTRKENDDLGCDPKLFKQIVKQSFSQRRKMLRNTMKMFTDSPELMEDKFFQQRPEKLSVQDFIYLTNWTEERRKV